VARQLVLLPMTRSDPNPGFKVEYLTDCTRLEFYNTHLGHSMSVQQIFRKFPA